MQRPDSRKQLGTLLLVLLALGLAAYAAINILRWQISVPGGKKDGNLTITRVALGQAPAAVRDAAAKLDTSRVGYVIPQGNVTYVVVSTGLTGEAIDLAGARQTGNIINVDLRSGTAGDRLIIGMLKVPVTDPRLVQIYLDGTKGAIPALFNPDNLPLVALPDKGPVVLLSPVSGDTVPPGAIVVTGYARMLNGQFSVTVYSQGKGKMLGQEEKVMAAAGAPNWGSFRATIQYDAKGLSDGFVLVYDDNTSSKVTVPVHFGTK